MSDNHKLQKVEDQGQKLPYKKESSQLDITGASDQNPGLPASELESNTRRAAGSGCKISAENTIKRWPLKVS